MKFGPWLTGRISLETRRLMRGLAQVDRKVIKQHFEQEGLRRLHIGCGPNVLGGWLNSDLYPHRTDILHLDATKLFPFGDRQFDYVFSEHVLEHIPVDGGMSMLRECFRVLKPGGTLRISTPDLSFLINLYPGAGQLSDLQNSYVEWATAATVDWPPSCRTVLAINDYFRSWGHRFIYDEGTLRAFLERAGFTDIAKCGLGESQDEALRGLENKQRMPEGFLSLESMILEASKRAAPY